MNGETKAVQRTAERIKAMLQHIKFKPQFAAAFLRQARILSHSSGYFRWIAKPIANL
jgi:hypothetical protein